MATDLLIVTMTTLVLFSFYLHLLHLLHPFCIPGIRTFNRINRIISIFCSSSQHVFILIFNFACEPSLHYNNTIQHVPGARVLVI